MIADTRCGHYILAVVVVVIVVIRIVIIVNDIGAVRRKPVIAPVIPSVPTPPWVIETCRIPAVVPWLLNDYDGGIAPEWIVEITVIIYPARREIVIVPTIVKVVIPGAV